MIVKDNKFFISGKVIGEVSGNTFHKKVNNKKHYMRMFDAYGIQEEVFGELAGMGIDRIIIKDNEGNMYSSYVEDWLTKGFVKELGYGEQRFLERKYYKSDNQIRLI